MNQGPAANLELPDWAVEMRDLFRSGSAAQFLLHGNVFDVVPSDGKLLSVPSFLEQVMWSVRTVALLCGCRSSLDMADAPRHLGAELGWWLLRRRAPSPRPSRQCDLADPARPTICRPRNERERDGEPSWFPGPEWSDRAFHHGSRSAAHVRARRR